MSRKAGSPRVRGLQEAQKEVKSGGGVVKGYQDADDGHGDAHVFRRARNPIVKFQRAVCCQETNNFTFSHGKIVLFHGHKSALFTGNLTDKSVRGCWSPKTNTGFQAQGHFWEASRSSLRLPFHSRDPRPTFDIPSVHTITCKTQHLTGALPPIPLLPTKHVPSNNHILLQKKTTFRLLSQPPETPHGIGEITSVRRALDAHPIATCKV